MFPSFLMRASDSGQLYYFLLEMPATTFSGPNPCTSVRMTHPTYVYTCILSLSWGRWCMSREVLTSLSLKDTIAYSHYRKVRDRASYAFALVSVAAALDV